MAGSSPQRSRVEAVLFDLGDTLVHFETSRVSAVLSESCRPSYDHLVEIGHNLPDYPTYLKAVKRRFMRDWLRSKVTRREVQLLKCMERLHKGLGAHLSQEELEDVMCQTSTPAMKALTTVDDHAASVLENLRDQGMRMGVVSNTCFPSVAIDTYLETKGLLKFFPIRVYSSDVRFMKPSRQIFRFALDQLDIEPGRILYVGDRLDNDVMGASRVGMKTVHYSPQRRRRNWLVIPDFSITSLPELTTIVARAAAEFAT
ncbi:MAG: HAD family hydrolase [Planctomycetota bacterium]|jgi:HAD superfamily hydrolase (TIGR01662 family)